MAGSSMQIPGGYQSEAACIGNAAMFVGSSQDLTYVYWRARTAAQGGNICTSTKTPPVADAIQEAPDAAGTCGSGQYKVVEMNTHMVFRGCTDTHAASSGRLYITSATSNAQDCFKACQTAFGDQSTMAVAWKPGNGITDKWCECAVGLNWGLPRACGPDTDFIYTLARSPVASALVRRNQDGKIEPRGDKMAQRASLGLCPAPLEACRVAAHSADYECIDSSEELESCGGCVHGSRTNSTGLVGQDCTALQGIASEGSVSCIKGECRAYGCLPGWNLVDGSCFEALSA